jgi:hypothetical protein
MPRQSDFSGSLPRPETPNTMTEVEVTLREAGKFGFVAGSFIKPSPPPMRHNEIHIELDDRDYDVGSGSYDVATDTLMMEQCGPNLNAHPGKLIGPIEP